MLKQLPEMIELLIKNKKKSSGRGFITVMDQFVQRIPIIHATAKAEFFIGYFLGGIYNFQYAQLKAELGVVASFWKYDDNNKRLDLVFKINDQNNNPSRLLLRSITILAAESSSPVRKSTDVPYKDLVFEDTLFAELAYKKPDHTDGKYYFKIIFSITYGKAIQHTDLSGAVYHYQYDHKKQVIEASSQGGDHGQYLQLDPHILQFENGLKIDIYALTPKPVPGQQLSYQYVSGRVTKLTDLASGKTTYYSYDTEGRRIGIRVAGQNGELLRETSAENDALGREILTRDNQAVFTTAYDAVSNRRYIKGVVNNSAGETLQQEVWWKYDAQDRVLLAEGILADGEIKLTSDQGTEFSYQADRRISEAQLDESDNKLVADLQYDIDGRLIGTNYHMAVETRTMEWTEREYDLAGWQKSYKDSFPANSWRKERVHIQHQRICNENGWLTDDTQIIDQDKPIHTEYQDLTALGLPQRQVIHYNDESANEDHLDYHYVGWDEWRVARIEGYRSNRHGRSPYASAQHFIGPNGEPNAVIGAQDADSREKDQHKYFQATADGLVIRRLYFEKKWFTFDYFVIAKETFYFYRVNGQYLGSYAGDKDGGFGLNFVRHQPQNRAGRELGISLMDGMNPGRAISFSPLGSNHVLNWWDKHYGQSDALANIPATYTSVTGDSYAAIAEKIYGDAGLASYIEAANGGGALIAGQTLVIPQLIVVRNKAGMALPYYQLLQIMQGSLLPHLQTPQPQEHHSFWGTLLRAIVVVVVVIFAPELVAALPAVLAGMVGLSHVILTAVVAGLMDAAAQGFCVGLGLLDHFSLAETLTVMLSAGLSAQLPAGLSPAEAKSAEAIAEHMLKVGMVNVEEQFAEMAIGVRDQFDVAGVALAMGSSGLGDKIGAEMKLDNPWVQRSLTDIGTAALSGVVRGRFDIEGLATQLIADNVGVTMQQAKAKSVSEDESYHQSQEASRGNSVANDLDEQWQSEFINEAKFAANTPLPSITFDVDDPWTADQLGQRVSEEVSRFQHVDLPRNPNGFWQRAEQRYKNSFERQALIAEGRASAYSESMRDSLAGAAANEQNYLDIGYSESVAETRVAEWMAPVVLSAAPPVISAAAAAAKAYGLMDKWGFFGKNGVESLETGGRQLVKVRDALRADEHAVQFYEKIRSNPSNADIQLIAKNTGMRDFQIQRIKQHLFFNTHELSSGVGRFSPDIEITDSWNRLQQGNFVKQDLELLKHEYFESRFEGIFKTDYMTAHNAAEDSLRKWDPLEFETTPDMMWRP